MQLVERAGLDDAAVRNTRMRVALRTVASRCAITKVVRSFITSSSAACTFVSVTGSSALVASSRIRIGGSFSKRTRDREALAFAAGQHPAAFADTGLKAVRIGSMKSSACARAAASRISCVGRVRLADAQVLGDRAVEQQHFLEHDADIATQRRQLEAADVHAVDLDRARLRIEHAMQQRQRGRFAAAGRADQRDTVSPGSAVKLRSTTAARLPS